MTFDQLRQAHPHLGFAVYAYDPGLGVTLEIMDGVTAFTFRGKSFRDCVYAAFPDLRPAPATPEPVQPVVQEQPSGLFD
jgi:hypothetical protein